MKIPTLVAAIFLSACSSAPDAGGGGESHEAGPTALTLKHHDARVMANQMRLFLMETDLAIESEGAVWDLTGTADEVAFARFLAASFDAPALTRQHRAMVKKFENGGARAALNAARAHADWGDDWLVAADSDGRWLAMIPDSDAAAFKRVLGAVRGDG